MAANDYDPTTQNRVSVLVPGFMGSTLAKQSGGSNTTVWPPLGAQSIEQIYEKRGLALPVITGLMGLAIAAFLAWTVSSVRSLRRSADGSSEYGGGPVSAIGVLGAALVGPEPVLHIYDKFLQGFASKVVFTTPDQVHETRKQAFVMFPYDFRLDVTLAADRLADTLIQVRDRAGVKQVNLVGHSLGALVAFACIARNHQRLKDVVHQVVLMGGPINGTPETLTNLLKPNQDNLALDVLSDARTMLSTWPSVYQMLPSRHYAQVSEGGFVYLRNAGANIRLSLRAGYRFIGGTFLNGTQIESALAFHEQIDAGFLASAFHDRTQLLQGEQPTNSGIAVPCDGGTWPIVAPSLTTRRHALTYLDDGRVVVRTSVETAWGLDHFSGDTFAISTARGRIAARVPENDLVLTGDDGPRTRWKINDNGDLLCGELVWELGELQHGSAYYPVRLVPAGHSTNPQRHFALDVADSATPWMSRIDGAAGDGTVTRTGEEKISVPSGATMAREVVSGVNHLELATEELSLKRLDSLLKSSERVRPMPATFRIAAGPAGGVGRLFSRPAPDYDVAAPARQKISRIALFGKTVDAIGGWVSALELTYSDGSSVKVGTPWPGDARIDAVLAPDEYIVGVNGSVHVQAMSGRTFQIVRNLIFTTSKPGGVFGAGGPPLAEGEFSYQALPGYHISGLFGRAGNTIDCLGVRYEQFPLGVPMLRQVFAVGPSGQTGGSMYWHNIDPYHSNMPIGSSRLQNVSVTVDNYCLPSLSVMYRTGAYGLIGIRRGQAQSFELGPDEYIVRMTGEIGTVMSFWTGAWPQVTSIRLETNTGRSVTFGRGGAQEGDALPFEYAAPEGYLINGFFARGDKWENWGLGAIGAWYAPIH